MTDEEKELTRKEVSEIALDVLTMIEKRIPEKPCRSARTQLILNQALLYVVNGTASLAAITP